METTMAVSCCVPHTGQWEATAYCVRWHTPIPDAQRTSHWASGSLSECMCCDLPTYTTMHRRIHTELCSVLVEHTAEELTITRVAPGNAASHAMNDLFNIEFDKANKMSPDFVMCNLLSTKLLNEVTCIMRATATWCCSAMCAGGTACTGIQDPQRSLPSNWGKIRTGGPTNGAPPPFGAPTHLAPRCNRHLCKGHYSA